MELRWTHTQKSVMFHSHFFYSTVGYNFFLFFIFLPLYVQEFFIFCLVFVRLDIIQRGDFVSTPVFTNYYAKTTQIVHRNNDAKSQHSACWVWSSHHLTPFERLKEKQNDKIWKWETYIVEIKSRKHFCFHLKCSWKLSTVKGKIWI